MSKVAQNGLKHILVLEFLKSNEIFKISKVATNKQPANHTYNHTDTIVTGQVAPHVETARLKSMELLFLVLSSFRGNHNVSIRQDWQ